MKNDHPESKLTEAANTTVEQCLGLAPEESCVIITDEERREVATALLDAATSITDDVSLVEIPVADQHGEEPPAGAAGAMLSTDVFLAPTTKSISHTDARSDACEFDARGATLPEITPEAFTTGLNTDYDAVEAECDRVESLVRHADEVRVVTDNGTDITFEVGNRSWLKDTGSVTSPGAFSNLPAGEVFISPESATGHFVVDGTMRPHGLLEGDQSVEVEVEDGRVTNISDEQVDEQFKTAAEEVGERAAYNLAELGIGTNAGVEELTGSVLLDEKAAGTVHIAIGDDSSIGGETKAPIHSDGVLRNPTVYVDGKEIVLPPA